MNNKGFTQAPNNGAGFTLLELLMVVALVALMSLAATGLFLSSIRGGSKVDQATEVKQNLQFALSTMEQVIRNAAGLDSCTQTPDTMNLTDQAGVAVTFSCGIGNIEKDGSSLTSDKVTVTTCEFVCDIDADGVRPPLVTVTLGGVSVLGGAEATEQTLVTSVSLRNY